MKFVHGRTLQKVVEEYHAADPRGAFARSEPVPPAPDLLSLCQTVAYAHSRACCTGDLKPEQRHDGPYGETLLLELGASAKVWVNRRAPPSRAMLVCPTCSKRP